MSRVTILSFCSRIFGEFIGIKGQSSFLAHTSFHPRGTSESVWNETQSVSLANGGKILFNKWILEFPTETS